MGTRLVAGLLLVACSKQEPASAIPRQKSPQGSVAVPSLHMDDPSVPEPSQGESGDETGADPALSGEVVLGRIETSLSGDLASKIILLEITLQASPDDVQAIEARAYRARDAIILRVGDYTYEEIQSMDSPLVLQEELLRQVRAALTPLEVEGLVITRRMVGS